MNCITLETLLQCTEWVHQNPSPVKNPVGKKALKGKLLSGLQYCDEGSLKRTATQTRVGNEIEWSWIMMKASEH